MSKEIDFLRKSNLNKELMEESKKRRLIHCALEIGSGKEFPNFNVEKNECVEILKSTEIE